jgi:cytoskeletal protein CcmA (bactofilin family)
MGVDHLGLSMTIDDLMRLIRRICTDTIQNSAIGHAGITVYDGGWIRIEDGGLDVTGTQTVSGLLSGSGELRWSGVMNITGSQHVTGPTVFDGSLRVNGPIDVYGTWKLIGNGQIQGNVVVTGNVDVNSPGRIRINGGSSPATLEDGRLSFGTGGVVEADVTNGGVRLNVGVNRVYVGTGAVAIQRGGVSIILSGSGITMTGVSDIDSASAGGLPSGALWMSPSGQLFKVS